jgi:ATP-dependent DNA helicase RecQ
MKSDDIEYDHNLFKQLRKKRKEIADDSNLPPYVIFPDKTLIEMAAYFPQSENSLLKIHGVGSAKLEKYGTIFLDLITQYCRDNHIEEKSKKWWKKGNATQKSTKKPRYLVVGELFNSGISVKKIIYTFAIKQTTVLEHLYKFIQEGYTLNRPDEFLSLSSLSLDEQKEVLTSFNKLGTEYLKPVFEEVDGKVDYEELRIMRLYHLCVK